MNRLCWLVAGLFPALLVIGGCGSSITSQPVREAGKTEEMFVRVEGMGRQNGFL
jgi:hypothetical protein